MNPSIQNSVDISIRWKIYFQLFFSFPSSFFLVWVFTQIIRHWAILPTDLQVTVKINDECFNVSFRLLFHLGPFYPRRNISAWPNAVLNWYKSKKEREEKKKIEKKNIYFILYRFFLSISSLMLCSSWYTYLHHQRNARDTRRISNIPIRIKWGIFFFLLI